MSFPFVPFPQNPLRTREDLQDSLRGLLAPLSAAFTVGGLHLGNAGAHFSPRVALMEGWSRTIWGVAPLLAGGGVYADADRHVETLRKGIDPDSDGYWDLPGDRDQRYVEMAAIALGLLIAPAYYWEPLSAPQKRQLHVWLSAIETHGIPQNNWHFFRVLVACAFRNLGLAVNGDAEAESLAMIESCWRGDGWYVDGANNTYDLYNPFAFHFYGMIYARFASERDPERCERFRSRAREFAGQFLPFFREDGSFVPFGRSLTYRFAAVSFFSACAFAGLEVLPWGVMKGIVLRNLRWWFSRPILDAAGLLSVGYSYPDLLMAEQYNSPGSPYWALKTYLVLALDGVHPFWLADEAPLPEIADVTSLPVPRYILSRSTADVQLLTPGWYPGWEAVQAAAKYGKFVYSARFGFCVSHGNYTLEKAGGDSALLLSEGDNYWRERRETTEQDCGSNWTASTWKPWSDVTIRTILVGLGAWHVRIHLIESARTLETAEGGFSLPRFRLHEKAVPPEILLDGESAAIRYPWGSSRIVNLGPITRRGEKVQVEPNLNILENSALIPMLRGAISPGSSILACAVHAGDGQSLAEMRVPRLDLTGGLLRVMDCEGRVAASVGTNNQ